MLGFGKDIKISGGVGGMGTIDLDAYDMGWGGGRFTQILNTTPLFFNPDIFA